MTVRNPLVLIDGRICELPVGDETPSNMEIQLAILNQVRLNTRLLADSSQQLYLENPGTAFWATQQ